MPTAALALELATYEAHRDELVATDLGRYVLIFGPDVIDTFSSESDALRQGYRQFGNTAFFVRRIQHVDLPIFIG